MLLEINPKFSHKALKNQRQKNGWQKNEKGANHERRETHEKNGSQPRMPRMKIFCIRGIRGCPFFVTDAARNRESSSRAAKK
jgi:hypothetical protein